MVSIHVYQLSATTRRLDIELPSTLIAGNEIRCKQIGRKFQFSTIYSDFNYFFPNIISSFTRLSTQAGRISSIEHNSGIVRHRLQYRYSALYTEPRYASSCSSPFCRLPVRAVGACRVSPSCFARPADDQSTDRLEPFSRRAPLSGSPCPVYIWRSASRAARQRCHQKRARATTHDNGPPPERAHR